MVRPCEVCRTRCSDVYCAACVAAALRAAHERHVRAQQIWSAARAECAAYFLQSRREPRTLREYPAQIQQRRRAWEPLRQQCSQAARETVALQGRIVERQQNCEDGAAGRRRQVLSRLQNQLCGYNESGINSHTKEDAMEDASLEEASSTRGALIDAIQEAQQSIRQLRFHWTIQAFQMLRLQVDAEDLYASASSATTTSTRRPSGIGKISGLPLPHAGPELYGVLPREELQSALLLVAQLTHLAARCLGIVLPHPIVLPPPHRPSPLTNVRTAVLEPALLEEMDIANISLVTAATAKSVVPLVPHDDPSREVAASLDASHHAAVLAEDVRRHTLYSLRGDHFADGLPLLQNDVLVLCLRAGVPIPQLYPGEALLLNLAALYGHCRAQVGEAPPME